MDEPLVIIAFPEPIKSGVYFEKIEPLVARTRLEYWFDGIHKFRLVSSMKKIDPDFDLPKWESKLAWGHRARQESIVKASLMEDSEDEGLYD